MPRLKPITQKSELPAEHQPIADDIVKVFGRIGGPFSMLLHSPKLAAKILPLVPFVRDECIVKPNLRFPAILTAARENEAAYVWAAQVGQARKAGVREDLIDLIRSKGDASKLPVEEREVVEYARQLVRNRKVDQATFDALNKRHGAQWMVDLTATIGYFGFVSGIASAFEVMPPADGDKLPAK
jgi:4-carboxymuconolactone decarboxylase